MRGSTGLLALVIAVASSPRVLAGADAVPDPFTLDVAAAQGKSETTLALPDNGLVQFLIIRQIDDVKSLKPFSALASGFQDSSGAPVNCDVTLGGQTTDGRSTFKADQRTLPVTLRVRPIPALGKVTGVLNLLVDNQPVMSWRLALQRATIRNATLTVDQNVRVVNITCPVWGCDRADPFAVVATIREKSALLPLERVSVRLDQVAKAPASGFDLARNLAFDFNGRPSPGFTTTAGDEAAGRRVDAGGQAAVTLRLGNLDPGEYTATLRFQAVNSVDDDGQKLTLNIAVKHHWLLAALDLLIAILVSFIATKIVAATRERLALRARIDAIETEWFRQEPPTMLIVWAGATLRLAEDLLKKRRLAVEQTVEQRITDVSNLVPYLRRLRAFRQALAANSVPDWVRKRAMEVMEEKLAACGYPPFDAATLKKVDEALTELESWLPSWEDPYRACVVAATKALLSEVDPREVLNPRQRNVIAALKALLDNQLKITPPPSPVDLDRDYAKLLVIWRRRHVSGVFESLIDAHDAGKGVEALFNIADDVAWASLEADYAKMGVAGPSAAPRAYEAFQLSVTTTDTFLPETYLFRHGLRLKWRLTLPGKRRLILRGKRKQSTLVPETNEPTVIQFSPQEGEIAGKVEILRDGDGQVATPAGPAKPFRLSVEKSQTLRISKRLEGVELASLLFTSAFALVSGLLMFYVRPTSFGSVQDYLGLFLWGVTVDQSKNALQLLQGK